MLYTAAERLIDNNASPEEIRAFLQDPLNAIAAGRTDLLAVKHRLGFSSLYLETQGNRGVVLHLFHKTEDLAGHPDITTSDIHQHGWKMRARVLKEKIMNTECDVRPAGGSSDRAYRLFDAQTKGFTDHLIETDLDVIIRGQTKTTVGEHESYSMDIGPYHTTTWRKEALTLVLAENNPRATNYTLAPIMPHEPPETKLTTHTVQRKQYTLEQTAQLASKIAGMLDIELPALQHD